jgi:hypothetical protein
LRADGQRAAKPLTASPEVGRGVQNG